MNKKFLQSLATGIMGLSLAASCSMLKKESHNCGAKNGCASKKSEAVKTDAATVKAEKKSKRKKSAAKVEAVKTEEKTN